MGISVYSRHVATMIDEPESPLNCISWKPGDKTRYVEIDELLLHLFNHGFRTFMASGGLGVAVKGHRCVDVIHRGMLRRWQVGFFEHNVEKHSSMVRKPLVTLEMCVEWLNAGIEYAKGSASKELPSE